MTIRLVPSVLALAISAPMLGVCGQDAIGAETQVKRENARAPESRASNNCLAAADVSSAVGLEVREFSAGSKTYGDAVVCAYELADEKLGAFVTTVVASAKESEELFNDMKETVERSSGAKLQPIELGDRGYAYASTSKGEAAAVAGARLYHAEITSSASANLGDRKPGMIEILKKMMED
jgi:hypothetical protein